MLQTKDVPVEGFEEVIEISDDTAGLHGFIAIHNSSLGPALGGVRMYPYSSTAEALQDVLNLSKGMTYKSALAGLGLGGGKAVIIGDAATQKSEPLLLAFGKAIDSLKGRYICAEDVGTTTEDMSVIKRATPYVTALAGTHSSGDPSVFTAWGVYRGLQAIAMTLWGHADLRNRVVAVEGVGKVGGRLVDLLFWNGAKVVICDINPELVAEVAIRYAADVVSPEAIFEVECELFSPCALGGVLNSQTIPQLKCQGIGGSANNQLEDPSHGEMLLQKHILYAPDYVINSGGIINVSWELDPRGYHAERSRDQVDKIYDTLLDIFARSKTGHRPTSEVADELVQEKLQFGLGRRTSPIHWMA